MPSQADTMTFDQWGMLRASTVLKGYGRRQLEAIREAMLPEREPKKTFVIKGTCPTCGCVPGTVSRPLLLAERWGLEDAGYVVAVNAVGDDIASPPDRRGYFNDALAHFCRAGHPKPVRLTWHQRLLAV